MTRPRGVCTRVHAGSSVFNGQKTSIFQLAATRNMTESCAIIRGQAFACLQRSERVFFQKREEIASCELVSKDIERLYHEQVALAPSHSSRYP